MPLSAPSERGGRGGGGGGGGPASSPPAMLSRSVLVARLRVRSAPGIYPSSPPLSSVDFSTVFLLPMLSKSLKVLGWSLDPKEMLEGPARFPPPVRSIAGLESWLLKLTEPENQMERNK